MTAPLYNSIPLPESNEKGNKGLWFDRFFDQYDSAKWEVLKPNTNDDKKGNSHWLIKHFQNKKVGNDDQLATHTSQQQALVESLHGKHLVFSADWHFVTGMGNPHPVENGFAWHPTLGVPYLTGAAVKGIVRNYIENYLDDSDENKKALLFHWFGSDHKDPDKQDKQGKDSQTGNLIFFDALPIEPVTLSVDIMTPHMGDWYQKGAENPNEPKTLPADWHEPVPVTFLACKDISLQFSFGIRPRSDLDKQEPIDLDDVTEVLTQALKYLGAGGKTATGYGSMNIDLEKQKELKEQQDSKLAEQKKQQALEEAKQNMSPLAADFYQEMQDKNWQTDKNAFWQNGVIETWIEKLEAENDTQLLDQIITLMNIHFKGALENPDKTKGKKNKPVYKPRVIEIAKRLIALTTK